MDKKVLNSEFVELLALNYYKVHSFILALVPNRTNAGDILQSTITYMWDHFIDFKKGTNFLLRAFTISKYQVSTCRKNQKRSIIHSSDEAMDFIEQENKKLSHDLDARSGSLNTFMKKLNSKNLIFIKKRFEKKITVINLATEFGISVNMAYKRLARADGWVHMEYNLADWSNSWWQGADWDLAYSMWSLEVGSYGRVHP